MAAASAHQPWTKEEEEQVGGRHGVQILERVASAGKPINGYHAIPWQDGTLPEFWSSFQQLLNNGFLKATASPANGSTQLVEVTEAGQAVLQRRSCRVYTQLECTACEGRGFCLPAAPAASSSAAKPDWQEFYEDYAKMLSTRPPPAEEYDQTAIIDKDMMVRSAFMHMRGDVAGKNILLVGDADLLSLCLARSGLPARIQVIDIDTRVIDFVNQTAKERGWDSFLSARVFDVRLPFPADLSRSFDVFCSDPVETIDGLKLFLSHGAAALKGEGSVCYFGLTTLEAGRKKWYAIQKMLLEQNYVVTDIRRNFNSYYNTDFNDDWPIGQKLGPNDDDYQWYWTSFLRCEAIDVPQPLVPVDVERDVPVEIYRDDEAWATPPAK